MTSCGRWAAASPPSAACRPTYQTYHGVATGLRDVWLAVDDAIEDVVDHQPRDLLAEPSAAAPVA